MISAFYSTNIGNNLSFFCSIIPVYSVQLLELEFFQSNFRLVGRFAKLRSNCDGNGVNDARSDFVSPL